MRPRGSRGPRCVQGAVGVPNASKGQLGSQMLPRGKGGSYKCRGKLHVRPGCRDGEAASAGCGARGDEDADSRDPSMRSSAVRLEGICEPGHTGSATCDLPGHTGSAT
eukprot:354104-Chlamydomonas_euryale.AAC.3